MTLLRGAAYTARSTARPPCRPGTAASAAPYAHVTAPLRRLVDRFGTEVCLALAAGAEPAPDLRAALPELPALMAASDRRTREVERAVVDATEAWLLRGRVGQTFSAVVVDAEDGRAPSSRRPRHPRALPGRGAAPGHPGGRPARGGGRRRAQHPLHAWRPRRDPGAVPELPAAGLRDDGLRRDERARGRHRLGQPRAGLPRLPWPARGARRRPRGDRHRGRPVPARPGHPGAARGDRRAPQRFRGTRGTTPTTRSWSPPAPPRR